jgi:hypothetical protein
MSKIRQDSTQSGDGLHPTHVWYILVWLMTLADQQRSSTQPSGDVASPTIKCIGGGTLLEWWGGMGTKLRSMYMQI